jgi:hypothetical protein
VTEPLEGKGEAFLTMPQGRTDIATRPTGKRLCPWFRESQGRSD